MYLVLTIHNGKPHTVIEWENALQGDRQAGIVPTLDRGRDGQHLVRLSGGLQPAVGSTTPTATIGAEDLAGTAGVKYYYYAGTAEGKVPDGSVDVWVGLEPTTATLGFKANATAPANSNITNEAAVTVSTTTNTAWANTRICGAATATQPEIASRADVTPWWPGLRYA